MQALVAGARGIPGLELRIYSIKDMSDAACRDAFFHYVRQEADVLVVYSNANTVWDSMAEEVKALSQVVPVISFGNSANLLSYNTMPSSIAITVQQYLTYGGEENARNALLYIAKEALGQNFEIAPPAEIAWQGIYCFGVNEVMNSIAEYREKCSLYCPERPRKNAGY